MHRVFHIVGWTYVATCVALVASAVVAPPAPVAATAAAPAGGPRVTAASSAAEWFRRMKPYCNSVEITVLQRQSPAPHTVEGTGYAAACYALAGKIDDARRLIDALPHDDRFKAAGIVFEVGHPVADAGDDRSAGPIMELVIDYWPNHYMALYHAGMAEYMLGQHDLARHNLEQFLALYHQNDGWRANGVDVLKRLNDSSAARTDVRRPREPGQ